jgi:UrcA family protein
MKNYPTILCVAALAGTSAMVAPAAAQAPPPPEEIVVLGRYGTAPDSVRSLSQPVSYADLDLSTSAGRDELRRRVRLTARFLCDKLGESSSGSGPAPSCRDAATRDALSKLDPLERGFAPRGTTWVRPTPWDAPYPDEWVRLYP